MKQRLLTLTALLWCSVMMMMADTVSLGEARQAAMDFLKSHGATLRSEAARAKSQPMSGEDGEQVEASPYYVFNASRGFVVVSGDDCVGDNLVLGYAPQGSFSETNVPDGLQWWLESTARQIGELSRLGVKVGATPTHDAIDPMLTSVWDQQWPYNLDCPVFGGQRAVTGCMATALAQVMRYHRWPQEPLSGTLPAYTMATGAVIGALPVTQFDWDNMLDSYDDYASDAQLDAVAELMRYCGQSLQMEYSPAVSNGVCYDLDLLVNRFGYDPGLYSTNAYDYTVSGWDALIYNELHEGRPLVYCGRSTGGGHAFVIDGYDVESGEGYYHVNWGWGGGSDGYYKISLLNANGSGSGASTTKDGYNRDQSALIGFQPRRNPSEVFYRRLSSTAWDSTDGATWHSFTMRNQSYKAGQFTVRLAERKEDGTPAPNNFVLSENVDITGFTTASLLTDGQKGQIAYTITNTNAPYVFNGLTPGRHQYMFISRLNVVGAPWQPVYGPNCYIEVLIGATGKLQEMIVHPQPQLSIPDGGVKAEGPHQRGIIDRITATVNNTGSDDYIGYVEGVTYHLVDGILQSPSVSFTGIMIEAGGTSDVYFDVSVPHSGDYVFLITKGGLGTDESGRALADIQQSEGYVGHTCLSFGELQFYCLDAQYAVRYDVRENPWYSIDLSLKNETSLDYDAALLVKIFKSDGSGGYVPVEFPVYSDISTYLSLPDGQSAVITLMLPDALEAGDYDLNLYISNDFQSFKKSDYFCFASVPLTVNPSGIEEVKDLGFRIQDSSFGGQWSTDNDVWYDLSGRKLSGKPAQKGVYFHEGNKYLIP